MKNIKLKAYLTEILIEDGFPETINLHISSRHTKEELGYLMLLFADKNELEVKIKLTNHERQNNSKAG